jgi:hypothetical protein
MIVLLVSVAVLTVAVLGFAAVVAVKIVSERRGWQKGRQPRPTMILQAVEYDHEDANDVAACLQVWLDERWNDRFG